MAEPRKSAKQTDARRRAREKAAQFRELQDTLEQLATDYFVAVDSVDETNKEAELEIAKLRERAEQQTQKARDEADQVIVRMVAAGASPTEVAARLGVTVREVKKATKETPAPAAAETGTAPSEVDARGEEPNAQHNEGERDAA
jgi:DNA-directed RNA polymerase specialized sigma24 family protein